MRIILLVITLFINSVFIIGQSTSSLISTAVVYSENEKYFLKTIPYDNESPSLRGKTYVYQTGIEKPLYILERAFDTINKDDNELFLSNDGDVIFYVIDFAPNEEKEGLKSINVYKKGVLFKSFTASEITGCDLDKERCRISYSNFWDVVDEEKSNFGTAKYKRVFKDGVSEQDKFLADFDIFSIDDTVYLTDSKKKTHLFDLKTGDRFRSVSFDEIFLQIKDKGRFNKINVQNFESPYYDEFPETSIGLKTETRLADHLGMKSVEISSDDADIYRTYSFQIKGMLLRDGTFEVEEIELGDELPKEKILDFFKTTKFKTDKLPAEFEKYYVEDYFTLRNKNDKAARREKVIKDREDEERFKQRLVAEKIDNIYIPQNLEESFVELDKFLKDIDKQEMRSKQKRKEMLAYHMGLGMWMRNSWGLWGGSRLQKYFTDKGMTHADDMSSVILFYYYEWLNDRKESWKEWEKNPKLDYDQ